MLDRSEEGLPPLSAATADTVKVSRLEVDLVASNGLVDPGRKRSQVKVRCLVTLYDAYHRSNEVSVEVVTRGQKAEVTVPESSVVTQEIVDDESSVASRPIASSARFLIALGLCAKMSSSFS